MRKNEEVSSVLLSSFPNAKCTLDFVNPFQCLVAVLLSAQTNDSAVNKCTPQLFSAYPDPFALAKASVQEVEPFIQSLGLYHNKAKNLVDLANRLVNQFDNAVPLKKEDLISLPGVGIKTANVVLLECARIPSFPVDTHVGRIAKRLGYAKKNDEPEIVEKKLEKQFPKESWGSLHHCFIAFGREICHSQKPECERCRLQGYCSFYKKNSSTTGK